MDPIMDKYRRWNNITGWLIFLISAVVYLLTVEPTMSFWDCGEHILASYRLQVGHPPGAPLFLMISRIAALFAGSDNTKVPLMLSRASAVTSAFAILFLFWTITHLVRRVITRKAPLEARQIPLILGSGIIGALAYTFTDSFWFSAVEAELYALSSLILGFVFTPARWLIRRIDIDEFRWVPGASDSMPCIIALGKEDVGHVGLIALEYLQS